MESYLKNLDRFVLSRHKYYRNSMLNNPLSGVRQQYLEAKPLCPRESGKYIVQHAKYVTINQAGIIRLSERILQGIQSKEISVDNFSQHELHPTPDQPNVVEWIFVVDTLNFCFWTPNNYCKYKVRGYTGYFALCAAVNRALDEGLPITDATYYANLEESVLAHILRSDDGQTVIPLLKERLMCLHEVGKYLLGAYEGKFANMVKLAKNSAEDLLSLIVSEFICYRDTASFESNVTVALYKRAQILIGDIWSCYGGQGLGYFQDIEGITMFADYRVPQVLVHFGALEYNDELMQVLKSDKILENGDRMEVEIRGSSIYVVEMVKDIVWEYIDKHHPELHRSMVNSILIDHFLWDYRRKHADELESIPFHKTLSIYY